MSYVTVDVRLYACRGLPWLFLYSIQVSVITNLNHQTHKHVLTIRADTAFRFYTALRSSDRIACVRHSRACTIKADVPSRSRLVWSGFRGEQERVRHCSCGRRGDERGRWQQTHSHKQRSHRASLSVRQSTFSASTRENFFPLSSPKMESRANLCKTVILVRASGEEQRGRSRSRLTSCRQRRCHSFDVGLCNEPRRLFLTKIA